MTDEESKDSNPAAAESQALPPDAPRDLAHRIEDMTATEGAMLLQKLDNQLSADVTEYLDPNTAADVLKEMDPTLAASVISDMEMPEASVVLAAMNPDDRVDILGHVPNPLHDQLLSEMTVAEQRETRQLEQYPSDSAGGIMTPEVTALGEDLTIEEAINELRVLNQHIEQMFYVYVVDKRGHLVGVLSMRDLIMQRPDKKLSQIMRTGVIAVPATMDQEEVANLIRNRNYLAVPVVDDKNKLLGIITVDDVVDVFQEEATEDVQKMFGAGAEERLSSPWQFSFRKRFWWLVVNLGTAFLAAAVVGLFKATIESLVALAVYMPVVAGMGGNASAQAMSVAIRGIATGKVDRQLMRHVFLRELFVGVSTGVLIGLMTAAVAVWFDQDRKLGLVICLALLVNHTLACSTGSMIPFVMKRLGFDPAQSATIIATTVTDVAGFFSLLGLARLILIK